MTYFRYFLGGLLLTLLCSCRPHRHVAPLDGHDDLQQIRDSNELVMLTLYSSTSYFIYRGQEMGFQYEL